MMQYNAHVREYRRYYAPLADIEDAIIGAALIAMLVSTTDVPYDEICVDAGETDIDLWANTNIENINHKYVTIANEKS